MQKIQKCPYCEGKEFVEAVQSGYSALAPVDKILTFKSQALYHIICFNCGAVIKSYVKNPKKLVVNK